MQQQQQPTAEMPPFSPAGWAPAPISSRPPAPAPGQQQQQQTVAGAEELGGAAASASGSGSLDGEEGGSSSMAAGNRWPREETLALLKIRSDMDAAFREAALKGPLWEQVSRRIGEMGYKRSAKKCREKFENVDKYYRRTKDGRAGRAHGKTYRFFSELEALHSISMSSSAAAHPPPLPAVAPPPPPTKLLAAPSPLPAMAAPSLSSLGGGSDGSETDDDEIAAEGGKKRKRGSSWSDITSSSSGKKQAGTMRLFEGMMRQVMERQEAMQRRLLDAIERRDQERLAREESWRRQENARLAREQDALAHDRAAAAARDAAVVSFIHRVTGQMPVPPPAPETKTTTKAAMLKPPPPLQPTTPRNQPQQPHVAMPMPAPASAPARAETPPAAQSKEVAAVGADTAAAGSRWPKAEVHALIELRTEMEARYGGGGGHEAPNKGPLWEDIAAGMRRLGYARSSKRCKEKWENINKYFKKVKESSRSKQRPVDSKTCPYFHQLDKLYRTKAQQHASAAASQSPAAPMAAVPLSSQTPAPHIVEHGPGKNCTYGNGKGNGMQAVKASNGNAAERFFPSVVESAGGNGTPANKLESKQDGTIAKETTEQQPQPAGIPMVPMSNNLHNYGNGRTAEVMHPGMDDDSDSMEDDDDLDSEEDEDDAVGGGRNAQVQPYDIRFQSQQQQQQQHQNTNGGGNPPAAPASAAASGAAPAPFLAMVQ